MAGAVITSAAKMQIAIRQCVAAVAAVAALMIGCAVAPHWIAPERPTQRDAAILLDEGSTSSVEQQLPTGAPDIPAPRHLRPCCDFGYNLGLRYGFVPILGYRITNIKTIDEVGPHDYDSAVVTLGSRGELVSLENNGLVFTCRGGFIDTAHVRDYADWTIYLASKLSGQLRSGTTIELSNEGGKRRIVLEAMDPEYLRAHDPAALTMAIAQWLAVQLSIWHEIATWYGSSSFPGFPERASAFSPEDLYSNVLGTKIASAIVLAGGARSEILYARSADAWLRAVVDSLGPASKATAIEAMRSLDGIWWQSGVRLPDPRVLLRRDIATGDTFTPWLVPEEQASEGLRALLRRECGGWPKPVPLTSSSTFEEIPLRTLARFEVQVDPAIVSQPPFDALSSSVTQGDFPAILEAIREQNRREFGPFADRPDA